jgi:RNA-binding protein YlmH
MAALEGSLINRRLSELAQRARVRDAVVFTRFLDPAEQIIARDAARFAKVEITLCGGYMDAERCAAAFHPKGVAIDFTAAIACVLAKWAAAYGSPAHRDLLGASLAVIQDRSFLGDIILRDDCAYIFVIRDQAIHLAAETTQAGRVAVKCSVYEGAIVQGERDERFVRDTIPSFRLDAGTASAFWLSRAVAQEAIRAGKVKLNHIPETRTDAAIKEGDLISLRGIGRAKLFQALGVNRKGRLGVLWNCTPYNKRKP